MLVEKQWKPINNYLFRFGSAFCVLYIGSFSFGYDIIPDPSRITGLFFEWLVNIFTDLTGQSPTSIVSDSRGMYINVLMILILSVLIAIVWSIIDKKRINYVRAWYWSIAFLSYYLALQLMVYGFAKIFKIQFFLPEPNTLYTTIGATPRDLLYWSTIGLSRTYSIFLGSVEVLAAGLLLFQPTRLIGALVSTGIMVNVVAVNFSYDISVKVYSIFLLLLSLIILSRYFSRLKTLLPISEFKIVELWSPNILGSKKTWIKASIKFIVVFLIIAEAAYPGWHDNNYNDDLKQRPYLHGAYQVDSFTVDGENSGDSGWKRVFVHRAGYFIIQTQNEEMIDYELSIDEQHNHLILFNYYDNFHDTLTFVTKDNSLSGLSGYIKGHRFSAILEKLPLESLKVLQNEFHWTID